MSKSHPHYCKVTKRYKWWILHVVKLFDACVTVFTLGFFCSHYYGDLLFSEWMDDCNDC